MFYGSIFSLLISRLDKIKSTIPKHACCLLYTSIIIASAALLIRGKSVTSFADIAAPFSIKFGIVGVEVFAVAFAFAGILAVVTVGLGTVYSASVSYTHLALGKYGSKLDIIYDDPAYPVGDRYQHVYLWNQTA